MTLNINTAKALLAVIKHNDGLRLRELDRVQVETLTVVSDDVQRVRRYVATNGHTLLVVEQEADGTDEGSGSYSLADLKEYVSSKGHSTLTDRSNDYGDFPDWESCVPTTAKAIDTIGLSAKYLKMMADIGRFLKVGDLWKATFAGNREATLWEAVEPGEYTRILFVIMPIRLD